MGCLQGMWAKGVMGEDWAQQMQGAAGTDIMRDSGVWCAKIQQDAESMWVMEHLLKHSKATLLFDCLHASLPLLRACLDTSAMQTPLLPAPHSSLAHRPGKASFLNCASRAPSHAPFRSSLAPPCASAT